MRILGSGLRKINLHLVLIIEEKCEIMQTRYICIAIEFNNEMGYNSVQGRINNLEKSNEKQG